jgi:hypothetical protein
MTSDMFRKTAFLFMAQGICGAPIVEGVNEEFTNTTAVLLPRSQYGTPQSSVLLEKLTVP